MLCGTDFSTLELISLYTIITIMHVLILQVKMTFIIKYTILFMIIMRIRFAKYYYEYSKNILRIISRLKVVLSLYGYDFISRNMHIYRTFIENLTRYME